MRARHPRPDVAAHHPRSNNSPKPRRSVWRAVVDALEERRMLTVPPWTLLSTSGSPPPDGGSSMNLLSNGSVLIQDGFANGGSTNYFTL